MRQEMVVVPLLSIDAMREYWYHVLVSLIVEMVDFVSFVDDVGHHIGRRGVDNGRRDDVHHVPMVLVFGNV
jgi:hypothetical protein